MDLKPSVILLGSKPGSVVALQKLLNAEWNIRAIIIPSKFDESWMPGPRLSEYAAKYAIPVFSNQNGIDIEDVDYVISYMYRNLVNEVIIQKAKIAAVNFHPAPLPQYGGFAFYNVAILESSDYYGCTCHHMDSSFDTGNLIKVRTFEIDSTKETALTLERKTQVEMLQLFDDFMNMVMTQEELPSVPQDPRLHRYMDKAEFQKLKIVNRGDSAEKIQRVARAFWFPPYECAHTIEEDGGKIQIIPNIVLTELGRDIHAHDMVRLQEGLNGFDT